MMSLQFALETRDAYTEIERKVSSALPLKTSEKFPFMSSSSDFVRNNAVIEKCMRIINFEMASSYNFFVHPSVCWKKVE